MERHRVTQEQALQQLLLKSRDTGLTLQQVSEELIAGIPADRN